MNNRFANMNRLVRELATIDGLQAIWADLNRRYFDGKLAPIDIVWSRRLTASVGMFVSETGPRAKCSPGQNATPRRMIRLSRPLLDRLAERTAYAEQELINTLAHEMIHQWQFDVLKRRPNHGSDFLRKMTEMNRTGRVAITIYHGLGHEVLSLSRYAWRCRQCGRIYRRQRRTIEPRRHHCGQCLGPLQELQPVREEPAAVRSIAADGPRSIPATAPSRPVTKPAQLSLAF